MVHAVVGWFPAGLLGKLSNASKKSQTPGRDYPKSPGDGGRRGHPPIGSTPHSGFLLVTWLCCADKVEYRPSGHVRC